MDNYYPDIGFTTKRVWSEWSSKEDPRFRKQEIEMIDDYGETGIDDWKRIDDVYSNNDFIDNEGPKRVDYDLLIGEMEDESCIMNSLDQ